MIDSSILVVPGVILGSVQFTSDTLDESSVGLGTLAKIWAILKPLLPSPSPGSPDFMRLFISTMTQGCESGDPKTDAELVTTYAECLESIAIDPNKGNHTETDIDFIRIERWIRIFTNARKMMLLDRGYMGLGPAVAVEGDLYGIIFGCTAPCILRATQEKGYYQFIGPCYIPSSSSTTSADGNLQYPWIMGAKYVKDWVKWDVEEQHLFLC